MPLYIYHASTVKGKITRGEKISSNPQYLKNTLRGEGLFLIDCQEKIEIKKGKKLKAPELSDFCRELGSLLSSGVSMVRSLNIVASRDLSPKLKLAFTNLLTQIKRGVALSDAMQLQGKTFPDMLINMIRSGESSGNMDATLLKMAEHYQKEHRLNSSIKSAMTYPCILAILMVVIVIGIFTFIMPTFIDLFEDMSIPKLTQILIAMSNALTQNFLSIAMVTTVIIMIIVIVLQLEPVKFQIDKLKVKMPKAGKLMGIIYTARFARTLSSLYSSGMSIINALQIAKDTIGNRYISSQFDAVIRSVRSGNSLAQSLEMIDGFDNKLFQTVSVGEETGQLDTLLEATAESYEYESQVAIKKLVTLIEPIMICVMAVVVVIVIVGVMMPIYTMYGDIEGRGA